jgi:hypothetical protein
MEYICLQGTVMRDLEFLFEYPILGSVVQSRSVSGDGNKSSKANHVFDRNFFVLLFKVQSYD